MQSGIKYFPLDVTMDDSVKLLEVEFGPKGFATLIKLWQRIYGGEGYYMKWNKDVALLFSNEINLGYNVVSEIVLAAIDRGIFSPEMFKRFHILTSTGIQKRYLEATARRKEVQLIEQYLLVNVGEKYKNAHITSENVYIFDRSVNIKEQKKEIKEKNLVVEVTPEEEIYISFFGTPTENVKKQLHEYAKSLSLELIYHILDAAKTDSKPWNWVRAVMDTTIRDNVRTIEEYEYNRKKHNIKRSQSKSVSKFKNYTQTAEYDFDAIEKRALEKRLNAYDGTE